jgi:hypothetical protein
LWQRFTTRLRREIAARAGLTQRELKESARLSYGKVAEFQKRGAVHFHAVIRIDGPEGPDALPPAWVTVGLLTDAIRAAAAHSSTPRSRCRPLATSPNVRSDGAPSSTCGP